MDPDETVQRHLALALQYLGAAELAAANDLWAPAHHDALHALELALKAVLLAHGEPLRRLHNVVGHFGFRFRNEVDDALLRQLNRTMDRYHDMRYPDRRTPSAEVVEDDLALARTFIHEEVPRLLAKARATDD